MNEQTRIHLTNLQNKLKEISRYSHCARLMSFDRETIAPKDALENENETLDFLYAKIFEIKKTKEYEESIVYLHDHIDELEPLDQRLITLLYRNYEDNINVTPELDARRNTLFNKAYVDWLKAKSESNYSLFSSDLKDIIEITKEFIDLRPAKKEIIYDNLIGGYEEGMTTEKLDKFFNSLKERIVPLLRKIQNSKTKIRTDFLTRPVSIEKQAKFSEYLLNVIGFDFNKGMLSTTEHPFTSDIGYNDVRVTTHYYENLFLSNVYSVIHEGGHAIFGQCETQDKYDHFIDQSMTMAMHESVSRFYENRIGRSREFIHLIYPKFKELFADEFSDVSEEELYNGVNVVEASLIRTEADELTYSLHVIVRYEMEKALSEGRITVDEAPAMWNKLYEEYLGVKPNNDSEGILQDVHWASGFGYFPTYALGNAYNAMYILEMQKDFDVFKAVENGEMHKINSWMKEHVFKNASVLDPNDWIKSICDKELDPTPYLDYLEEKYSKIYKL